MLRSIATLALVAAFGAASAQDIPVTEAMTAKAKAKTDLVASTVGGINENQRTEINAAYLEMEKYAAALEMRFAGQPPEQREADMPAQVANMDRFIQEKLSTILTEQQYTAWKEASR
jgi:hypothetical protein